LRPTAPALDSAGVETVSGPEPLRALAARVLWLLAIGVELLAVRMYVAPHWSYGFLDGMLIFISVRCAVLVLSAVPGFHRLEDPRPRPSFERTVRIGFWVAAIQVYVISCLLLRDLPGDGWVLGGVVVYLIGVFVLTPWIADRWDPAVRRAHGSHKTS
jgi:hypothetical protein